MNGVRPKQPRLRLDSESYEQLRNRVLKRDGWRCQACGSMPNLEVHHQEFRSHSGEDSEQNLITLCSACHARAHTLRVDLTSNNYETVHAQDGYAAVAVAQKEHPDLIVLDLGLPAGDGFVVLERLQNIDTLAGIPVVVVTARGSPEQRRTSSERRRCGILSEAG